MRLDATIRQNSGRALPHETRSMHRIADPE